MDGALVHLVDDPCTPDNMARADVPLDLALWYHAQRPEFCIYTEEEVRQILTVRAMVRKRTGAGSANDSCVNLECA